MPFSQQIAPQSLIVAVFTLLSVSGCLEVGELGYDLVNHILELIDFDIGNIFVYTFDFEAQACSKKSSSLPIITSTFRAIARLTSWAFEYRLLISIGMGDNLSHRIPPCHIFEPTGRLQQ